MNKLIPSLKLIKRVRCVICESISLVSYKYLAKFPIYMGVTEQPLADDIYMDQKWSLCKDCFCLQLVELAPLEVLYSRNHSVEAVGNIWQTHHKEFAKTIIKDSPVSICEIGGSHGFLAKQIISLLPDIKYLMVEPDPTLDDNRIKIVKSYFEDNPKIVKDYDNIVHSHVLEHLYEPLKFLSEINNNIQDSTIINMSIPNINQLLVNLGTNALNFEHTYFLTLENLEYMAAKTGFEIIEIDNYINHSFFVKMKKNKNGKINIEKLRLSNEFNLKNFDLLWDGLSRFVNKTSDVINSEPNVPTYIFGAHVFSQSLYYLGLDKCKIAGVLDNASLKISKRLYGTPYEVFQPEAISNIKNVRVILKAANYQSEIKRQLIEINNNVEIIE
jgi:hypothetical protein